LPARLIPGRAMADDLGDHRIVVRRNLGAGLQRVFDPNAFPASAHSAIRPDCGMKIVAGIFGAQPHLDRMAGET